MTNNLKPGERLDDLQIKGYEIIQSPGRFCFGMDAVLLSAFAKVKAGECVLDLGTGTGILPILLAAKTKGKHFTGLEIQEESADMACRSVRHCRMWHSQCSDRTWPDGKLESGGGSFYKKRCA